MYRGVANFSTGRGGLKVLRGQDLRAHPPGHAFVVFTFMPYSVLGSAKPVLYLIYI